MNAKFLEHSGYLEVILTDERSFTMLSNLLDIIYKECQKNNLKKILIDAVGAKGEWKDFDRFQIGEKASRLFRAPYKILGIDKAENINKFIETVAVNRGINVLIASDKKKGLDWLLGNK